MKKYFYSAAYFVVIGLLFATLFIMVPVQIMSYIHGEKGLFDMLQSFILIPFIAAATGSLLAGIPVVLAGFLMAFFNRYAMPIFLLLTVFVSLLSEFIYCHLLNIRPDFIPAILIVTGITTFCLCLIWRLWLEPRIE